MLGQRTKHWPDIEHQLRYNVVWRWYMIRRHYQVNISHNTEWQWRWTHRPHTDVLAGWGCPVNTGCSPDVGLMLVRRLRRRTNINPTLGERLVFPRMYAHKISLIHKWARFSINTTGFLLLLLRLTFLIGLTKVMVWPRSLQQPGSQAPDWSE